MKANFEISLPSIPGKSIKFKIQDIKSTSFGSQKARFPDNKSLLTKKFVQSFSNFHQSAARQTQHSNKRDDDQETQAESEYLQKSRTYQKQTKFRTMVSENKKFLIPIFNKIRKEERVEFSTDQSFVQNGTKQEKKTRGVSYSFTKSAKDNGLQVKAQCEDQQYLTKYRKNNPDGSPITDNYYFSVDKGQISHVEQEENIQKKQHPSAVFKNQPRKRFENRVYSSTNPGPGSYLKDKPSQEKKKKDNKSKKVSMNKSSQQMDYKRLKQVISNIVQEQPQQLEDERLQQTNEVRNDHMFVLDDRDRFGQQAFPIATRINVPGPGSYDINDTMQEKSRKVLLVEEQRKLLKQWFNN